MADDAPPSDETPRVDAAAPVEQFPLVELAESSMASPAPGEKAPGEKAPGEKAPGEKAPGEKAPGEKAPPVEMADVAPAAVAPPTDEAPFAVVPADEVAAAPPVNSFAPQGRSSSRATRVVPVLPSRASSALRQRLLIGGAFLAPCLVIALSLFFILRGGAPRARLPGSAINAQPAPSSSPTQFPGETEGDTPELDEPTSDAAPSPGPSISDAASLEQPNQVVPEVASEAVALPGFEDETGDEEPAPSKPAPPKHFATVQEAAAGSCSTESVDKLSRQIIDQARCIKPNEFVPLPKRANLLMAPNVYPYLELGARDHLLRALDSKKGQTMTINSALRTVAQQYLVSHWSLSKICGVQLATRPGESNHEIGTALDIKEAASWRPALEAQDFKWLGASDRVHFDYKSASPTRAATDVLAFQKLWNRNHKDDAITESGRFDAATEQRLKKAPPSGFALGASCAQGRPR